MKFKFDKIKPYIFYEEESNLGIYDGSGTMVGTTLTVSHGIGDSDMFLTYGGDGNERMVSWEVITNSQTPRNGELMYNTETRQIQYYNADEEIWLDLSPNMLTNE